jgi:hypothetical protein
MRLTRFLAAASVSTFTTLWVLMKKLAFTPLALRVSSTLGVFTRSGPSSKVRTMVVLGM